MRKIKNIFFAFMLFLLLVGCSGGSVTGKYYGYDGDTKNEESWIELKGGKKWTDSDGLSGRYELSGTTITFLADMFGSEEELFDGTIDGGVITVSILGFETSWKKDGASGPSSDEEVPEKKRILDMINIQEFKLNEDESEISLQVKAGVDKINMADYINSFGSYTWNVYKVENDNLVSDDYVNTSTANSNYYIKITDLLNEEISYKIKIVITKDPSYTITFYDEDGLVIDSQGGYSTGKMVDFPKYEVLGHIVKWKIENGPLVFSGYSFNESRNINIHANVSPDEYTVTLDHNDGYGNFQYYYAEYGVFNKFPVPSSYYESNEFLGWAFVDGDNTVFVTDEQGNSLKSWNYTVRYLELKAIWKEDKYVAITPSTNIYDAGTVTKSFTAVAGEEVEVSIVESDNYEFKGWFINDVPVSTDKTYRFIAPNEDIEIVAKCEGIKQRVYLNAYEINKYVEITYGEDFTLDIPYSKGYRFAGWYKGSIEITDKYGKNVGITNINNATLTPKWDSSYVTYNIYNENAKGKITVDNYEHNAGKKVVGSIVKFAATANPGFAFVGWYKGDKLISDKPLLEMEMPDISYLNLKTYYTPNKYLVYFNSNGGIEETTSKEVQYFGSFDGIVPTREGFTFLGWFDKDIMYINANGKNVKTYDYLGNLILTAKWEKDSFDLNVSGYENKGIITGTGKKEYNSEVILKAEPVPGYKFLGWFVDDQLKSDEHYYQFTMPKADVNLVTKWEALEYNVELYDEDSLVKVLQIKFNEKVEFPVIEDKLYYTFGGWVIGDNQYTNALGEAIIAYDQAKNTQMTVKWIPDEFQVEVINDDEKGIITGAGLHGYKTDVVLKAIPSTGWVFDGWYDGVELLSKNSEYKFNLAKAEDITITTKWKVKTYRISLDKNWDKASITQLSFDLDHNQLNFKLPIPTSSDKSLEFIGWYLGNVAYTDSYGNSLGVWNNEAVTLTAKWNTIIGMQYNFSVKKTSNSSGTGYGTSYFAETDKVVTVYVYSTYSISFGRPTDNGGYMYSPISGNNSFTFNIKKGESLSISISSNYNINVNVTGYVKFM